MNSSLPKDCNCIETPTNQGEVCTNAAYTTDEFFYNGPNSSCTELQNHDDITTAIQKLENFLCSVEVTQVFLNYLEENIQEFPEFITLVNDTLTCQTISNCFIAEPICFTLSVECESGSCPETFYITPSSNINDRPSYSIGGIYEVFYNPALNRWESWVGMALSSYLESNLFYPAGIWIAVTPAPFISISNNDICPTTTTTTTLGLCQEYLWESFGINSSNLEYKDCDGVSIVINSTNITNNSGTICVYPNTTPSWNPTPVSGYHQLSTVGDPCVNTTTTTSTSTSTSTTTTTSSTSTSTTTTTTTAVPICKSYVLEARITNASWFGTLCESDELTGGVVAVMGDTTNTGCIFDNSLSVNGMVINSEVECTTTTTSTSTSTTTTSTTSTSTTLYPCVNGQLLIVNNTENEVSEIYSTPNTWLIGIATPVGAFGVSTGIQSGTSNPISVDINYIQNGCISMYINTVLIQSIPFYWSDTYTFDAVTITSRDCVWFILDNTCI